MTERDEITLRLAQENLVAKQNASGMMTIALCAFSVYGFVYFVNSPSAHSAMFLGVCMVLLLASSVRLIGYAAEVAKVRNLLSARTIMADIVDVEVVERPIPPARYLLAQHSVLRRYNDFQG